MFFQKRKIWNSIFWRHEFWDIFSLRPDIQNIFVRGRTPGHFLSADGRPGHQDKFPFILLKVPIFLKDLSKKDCYYKYIIIYNINFQYHKLPWVHCHLVNQKIKFIISITPNFFTFNNFRIYLLFRLLTAIM